MARYASGRKAWGYSDRSGFRYRLREMRKEWNGLKVGPDEYEAKHPQLEPNYPGPDPTALYEPRPDSRTEVTVENILGLNPFSRILSAVFPSQKAPAFFSEPSIPSVSAAKAVIFDSFSMDVTSCDIT